MQIEFSSQFLKDLRKIPTDIQTSLYRITQTIESASSIREIPNCKKLQGSTNAYRIRIRDYRALFLLVERGDTLFFQRILTRGQIYKNS